MKVKDINWFAHQAGECSDNLEYVMPVSFYRVTWIDDKGNFRELITRSLEEAQTRKYEVDHSNGSESYLNFQSWFAYRSDEHERLFGRTERERGWWE